MKTKHYKQIVFVFIIYFFQGLIHNLGHPATPALVEGMGTEDVYFGIYFAAMSLGLLLGGPIWGYLGDRGNKRLYIVVGLLVYSVGQYFFAFIGDKNWMIAFRFLSGFGVSASVTLIMSHLIEHSEEKNRTVLLGWYQALFVLGTSVGYWLAGQLTEVSFLIDMFQTDDYRNIFLIQAVWNVVHAGYIFFLIGKPIRNEDYEPRIDSPNPFRAFGEIKHLDRNLLLFLISLAFISLGAINVTKYIEVYMNEIGLSVKNIGDFVGATGIASLLSTIFLVPVVAKLKRDFPIMIIIQIASAVIIFVVFRSNEIMLALYTLFMAYVILKAVYTPLEQHYISSHAPHGKYGKLMGIRQLFFSIGLVLGPLIGGFLYDVKPLYVFDFSVIMFLMGVILLFVVRNRLKKVNGQITQ
jgi:DHA1 family multidrug resistance protein-like MFS transporter